MWSKKSGFTLAEVLVTLVVIGVIAALTVPALLQNIQRLDRITLWKSAYSIVEQANKRALMDYGGDFTGVFQNHTDMKNKLKVYFSFIRECTTEQSAGNCWPAQVSQIDGTPIIMSDAPGLVLPNGMFVRFFMSTFSPASATACTETLAYAKGQCGTCTIDVNGFKGPNRLGEDIFAIHILSNKLVPGGAIYSVYYGNCGTSGLGCGALYLRQ